MAHPSGVTVSDVFPDSLAQMAGIEAGDRLLTINGEPVLDQLNYQFLVTGADRVKVLIEKPNGKQKRVHIDHGGDGLGLDLAQDPIKLCKQNCVFCFVKQMPPHFRPSLYLKDEDIRLSFLYGHFSTLSSSDNAELERVIREKLSPLHISVHATDPHMRIQLVGNPREGHILEKIDKLIAGGIQMHTQAVVVPGMNDGLIWENTLQALWARRVTARGSGGILSLSCVPVGLTAHRQGLPSLPPVDAPYAKSWVQRWVPAVRQHTAANDGTPWLLLADEWFAKAGVPMPGRSFYAKHWEQVENGVGLVRRFLTHGAGFLRTHKVQGYQGHRLLLLTGESFAPYLAPLIEKLNAQIGAYLKVLPVKNQTFGDTVSVAGLLCGKDLLAAAQADRTTCRTSPWVEGVVVPSASLCSQWGVSGQYALPHRPENLAKSVFLDDVTLADLTTQLGVPVFPSGDNLSMLLDYANTYLG